MQRRKSVWLALLIFALLFGLLSAPWLSIVSNYGRFFIALSRTALASERGPRQLEFELPERNAPHDYDARITIINRALMHPDGSGPIRTLDVAIGRTPTALLLALIVATPVPWKRRGRALIAGLILFHLAMLLVLSFLVWNESAYVELISLSSFWKKIADLGEHSMSAQFSPIVPVLVWILVTFRREDLKHFESLTERRQPA